jgi:hypothetical protein
MFREDYILRLIEQVGEALRKLAGLNAKGDHGAALAGIDEAWSKLDVPRELVEVVDTPTLAGMLRDPRTMRLVAGLFVEEARALAGRGDPVHAHVLIRRAMELHLEARAVDPEGRAEDEGALLELSRTVHANELDPRYRV